MGRLVLLNGRIADQKVNEIGRAVAAHVVGTVAVDEVGSHFQYVFNSSALAVVAQDALSFLNADTSDFVVTPDISAGDIHRPAGVSLIAMPVSTFGWIQKSGRVSIKSAAATALAPCALTGATDGAIIDGIIVAANDFAEHFGVILVNDAGGFAPCMLRGLL